MNEMKVTDHYRTELSKQKAGQLLTTGEETRFNPCFDHFLTRDY